MFDSSATTLSALCLTDYTTNANCMVPYYVLRDLFLCFIQVQDDVWKEMM